MNLDLEARVNQLQAQNIVDDATIELDRAKVRIVELKAESEAKANRMKAEHEQSFNDLKALYDLGCEKFNELQLARQSEKNKFNSKIEKLSRELKKLNSEFKKLFPEASRPE